MSKVYKCQLRTKENIVLDASSYTVFLSPLESGRLKCYASALSFNFEFIDICKTMSFYFQKCSFFFAFAKSDNMIQTIIFSQGIQFGYQKTQNVMLISNSLKWFLMNTPQKVYRQSCTQILSFTVLNLFSRFFAYNFKFFEVI
jgi:hypothetical protein